jgi:hypothetical protein
MAVPMANDPPFATLNHFAADLGIPSESDLLRIGIKPAQTFDDLRRPSKAGFLGGAPPPTPPKKILPLPTGALVLPDFV